MENSDLINLSLSLSLSLYLSLCNSGDRIPARQNANASDGEDGV